MKLADRVVLLTGGTGFVGSHLTEALVERGCRVRVLANYKSQPDVGNLCFLSPEVRSRIEIVWGDVSDRDSVDHVVAGATAVFHLAALIGIPYSYIAPESYVRTNVCGTLNVLQACRRHGVDRLVHTSTSEVYGSARFIPMDESHPLVGQSPYAASKIGADQLVESFHRSFELPTVTVRPFNVFGPRQSDRAVIPTIIAQCVAGLPEVRIGDPTPKRDFTFVTDTAEGFVRAAECEDAIGCTVNVGSGRSVSIGDVAELICRRAGGGRVVTDERRIRPKGSEVSELKCDATLAGSLLGWRPRVELTEGIDRTIEFVRRHADRFAAGEYRV